MSIRFKIILIIVILLPFLAVVTLENYGHLLEIDPINATSLDYAQTPIELLNVAPLENTPSSVILHRAENGELRRVTPNENQVIDYSSQK